MIVDFTINNFRSFQEEQTLSLVAENRGKKLTSNYAEVDSNLSVFRTAGIYGANASGKSNFLLAIEALKYLVITSEQLKDGEAIPPYEPFALSEESLQKPIELEIEYITPNSTRFVYRITFSKFKIEEESLDYYPSSYKANLFTREKDDSWDEIKYGSYLKGGKRKFAVFPNNSYLGEAGNSADSPEIIREAYNFFSGSVFYLGSQQEVRTYSWKTDKELIKTIENILGFVDTGIVGLDFEETDVEIDIRFPKDMPEHVKKRIIEENKTKILFVHQGKNGERSQLSEKEESSGTLKLFHSLPMLFMALRDGDTLFLDELDNSLHPHMAELIIRLFNDPNVNKNNGQLIFSTHNINLMAPEILRRDQIWLAEKTEGASRLFSLDEFDKSEVKLNSPYNRWYDEGRFGAIPFIDYKGISEEFKKMCAHNDAEE